MIQYLHPRNQGIRKILGWLLHISGYLLSLVFQLEIWMCITLALSFYQYDEPARIINWMIILNILVVRSFKRFGYRRRPSNMLPPRALYMKNREESSFPSMTVVTAATMIYATFLSEHKMSRYTDNSADVPIWAAIVMSLIFFVLMSLFRIHSGANYPSDCLVTFPIIIVILLLHWAFLEIGTLVSLCPVCDDTYCYYKGGNGSECTGLVTRENIDIFSLNPLTNSIAVIVGYFVMTFMNYPMDFWGKLEYFVPTFLAVWVF